MKKIFCLILALCIVFVSAGCNNKNDNEITVVLDWTPNTNHIGLYVAQKMGFYDEAGLDVKIVQPPEDGATMLVASGKAQFGISFQDSLAIALSADESIDVSAVAAICTHNLSGIISRGDKKIDSFKDMEGKTYATWGSPIEQIMIKYAMEKEGGDFEKLDMINSTVADVMSALDTDMIDTVWVYEYWDVVKAKCENYDYNYFDFKSVDDVFDYYTPVIISSNEYLLQHKDEAEKFIAATKKGYEYAARHSDEAAKILIEETVGLDEKLVYESAKFMSEYFLDESGEWGKIDRERWNGFYSWLYENKLIEKDLTNVGLADGFAE